MWFKIQKQQVTLTIFAKPNAKKTKLIAITDDALQIALHAKPHQGEANKELIAYLSRLLKLPKTQVILLKGEASRYKQVLLPLTERVKKLLEDTEQFL